MGRADGEIIALPFCWLLPVLSKTEPFLAVLQAKQKELYRALLDRNKKALKPAGGLDRYEKVGNMQNLAMELRKLCNHPTLIKDVEALWTEEAGPLSEEAMRTHIVIKGCGKMQLLDKMLPKLLAEGHKVLIFSQMVKMLDILEDYMDWRGYSCERLDGNIHGTERQAAIDRFSDTSAEPKAVEPFVFLLSTRAGGVGINLTAAGASPRTQTQHTSLGVLYELVC